MTQPTPDPGPVHVLSDLHLGHVGSRIAHPDQLAPLFAGAARVVFAGDSVELRHAAFLGRARELIEVLAAAVRAAGARPVFLTGNHDPAISTDHALELQDGRILLMHGDAVFPAISPWAVGASAMARRHVQAVRDAARAGHVDLRRRLTIARNLSLDLPENDWVVRQRQRPLLPILRRVARPWKLLTILGCWLRAPRLTADFCALFAPKARLVLVGHTHRAGVRTLRGITVVNLGGYLPGSTPWMARITAHHTALHRVHLENSRFQPKEIKRLS